MQSLCTLLDGYTTSANSFLWYGTSHPSMTCQTHDMAEIACCTQRPDIAVRHIMTRAYSSAAGRGTP